MFSSRYREALTCVRSSADHELLTGCRPATTARSPTGRRPTARDLSACVPLPAQQGRCRGSHAGRLIQGLPEGRRVPRRRGAVVLDLPHHLQRRDVAAAHGAYQRAQARIGRRDLPTATTATSRRRESPTGRRHGRRARAARRRCAARVHRGDPALPAIYRAPVMLRDIQGMSTEEASAMLRVKDQTLKSRLHRGRLILREQLARLRRRPDAARPHTAVRIARPIRRSPD